MSTINSQKNDLKASHLITAVEFSQLLQVSPRTLWRLRSAGRLPNAIRLGGVVRWRFSEVQDWIAKGCPIISARENEGGRK